MKHHVNDLTTPFDQLDHELSSLAFGISLKSLQVSNLRSFGDFYQQSIAEARLNELRKQIDEPKKSGWFN